MKTETSKKILMAKYCHSLKICAKSKENKNIHNQMKKKYISSKICAKNEKNTNIVKKKIKWLKV